MQDWKQIREILDGVDDISLFTHIHSDGDCLGSAFALAYFLAGKGKNVTIYNEEMPPENLKFIYGSQMPENMDFVIYGTEKYNKRTESLTPELTLAIDVSDEKRLGERKNLFEKGKITARIDHHITNGSFAENTVCNTNWAATAEGIYELLNSYSDFLNSPYIIDIAKCIHAGILTDTGSFAYSNVTSNTHYIAARLMEIAGNMAWQYSAVFENQTQSEIRLKAIAYNKLEYFSKGRISFLKITKEDLEKSGACNDDLSSLAPFLRSIKGVNVGVLVKPGDKAGDYRISLRSDECCDVNKVATAFGGGGHIRAAGIVFLKDNGVDFEEYKRQLIGEIERWME